VKNKEELRHVGNTHYLVYSKAHPPKVGAIPPAEIGELIVQNCTPHIDTIT
jgi:hypothetical protein